MDKCQCRPGCPFAAEPGHPFNLTHDPRPERQEERQRVVAENGARGGKQRAENEKRQRPKRSACSLRSTDDCLAELEKALLGVVNAAGDAVARAKAVTAIVAEARATLKASELEADNKVLRELLLERHPELKTHLKVVR